MTQAATTAVDTKTKRATRKKLKKAGRAKRATKIQNDKEFAKKVFEAKSKRSTDKKAAFRKKKKGKGK